MKTQSDVTVLYLNRPYEVNSLYGEISKVWISLAMKSTLDIAKEFPFLLDLSQRLKCEMETE